MTEKPIVSGVPGSAPAEPEEIHLPPNSWIPLSTSLALLVLFVGFLPPLGPWGGFLGAVWLAASLFAWYRSARSEYLDLPESGGH
ncbi:MAG: hypothetical protein ABR532_04200 [Candidatus Dormibacteria bacterium]